VRRQWPGAIDPRTARSVALGDELGCRGLPIRLSLTRLNGMDQVNVHEAKTHLSRLLERVEAGEEIIISRAGRPVARLVSYRGLRSRRHPGSWRGQVRIAPDFDELPADLAGAFRGEAS